LVRWLGPERARGSALDGPSGVRRRTGARRRASRQKNRAIANSKTAAPITITNASVPLRPPPAEVVELVAVRTVGVAVLGVVTGASGTPGENGLVVVCAPAGEGSAPSARTVTSSPIRRAARGPTVQGNLLVTASNRFP
jgi:hypothetical protein